jgi:predicted ribosome quality control (RQC) complex YloA/Tae2 family protein
VLSLAELERAARAVEARLGGQRLQEVAQPEATALVLTFDGAGGRARGEAAGGPAAGRRTHLLLSCRPGAARVSVVERPPRSGFAPQALAQYLRAHALGARLGAARLWDEDRQLALRLDAREGALELVLGILGPRSNLYLLDARGRLVAAARPLAETRAELGLGAPWQPPAKGPPRRGEDRFAGVSDAELLERIEALYASAEEGEREDALARRAEQALRRERKLLERRLERIAAELGEARRAGALEREGELLKGALGQVRRGDREVVAVDPATGERVPIALDPALSPSENLERLFKRYRKAVRTLAKAGAQEQAVRAELEALRADEAALAAAGSPAELEAVAARPRLARLLARAAASPAAGAAPGAARARSRGSAAGERVLGGRRVPASLAPRRYRTADGLEIWVGRSDAGNDFLSTRLARGSDLFFHLDGAPGSHVVLRTEGRSDPPSESLLDACELAVHFSKARRAGRADVHVVPIRNVSKPRGAKPGLVHVHGGRTIHLRRSDARLERLLASRIEDGDVA